jgi:hypothetical protein
LNGYFSLLAQRKVTKRNGTRSENSDPFAKNFREIFELAR